MVSLNTETSDNLFGRSFGQVRFIKLILGGCPRIAEGVIPAKAGIYKCLK